MKKILFLAVMLGSTCLFSQIETSLRWVGIGPTGGLNFFLDDSTDLVTIDCDYQTGFAIFTDPKDSLLYGVFRGTGEDYANNNLYIVNPFTGDIDLVEDFSHSSFTSADINDDGSIIYGIIGEGADLGDIIAYDTETGAETVLTTAFGVAGESTYGMEYHPLDSQLYIYEGSEVGDTRLQKIDINTLSNASVGLIGFDGFITGAKWTGINYQFIVSTSYDCSFLKTLPAATNELVEFYSSCMPETADIAEIHTIYAEGDSIAICPTDDSTQLELMYDVNSFAWYKDGVILPDETDPILTITEPGTYQAAMEIKTTTAMLFSKEIVVYYDPDCDASIGSNTVSPISLYPNPAQNELNIDSGTLIQSVQLKDMNGRHFFLEENIGTTTSTLDLSDLPKGIYIVEVRTDDGYHIERIVK